MGSTTVSSFDELVGLLHNLAPDTLAALRREYPEYAQHLDPGMIGGENSVADEARLRRMRVALARGALSRAHFLADTARVRLYRSIRAQAAFELALSLGAIAANVAAVALVDRPSAQLVTVLALVCAVGLVGANLLKLSALSPIPRIEAYRRMCRSIHRAHDLLIELTLCLHSTDGARIDDVVRQANVVAAELNADSESSGAPLARTGPPGTANESGHAVVRALLLSLFTTYDELLRWVKYNVADGGRIVTLLPSPSTSCHANDPEWPSRAAYAERLLAAHGLVDLDFFERLATTFPRRRDDIDRAYERWTAARAHADDELPST